MARDLDSPVAVTQVNEKRAKHARSIRIERQQVFVICETIVLIRSKSLPLSNLSCERSTQSNASVIFRAQVTETGRIQPRSEAISTYLPSKKREGTLPNVAPD